jgi:CheY-like chemotaxis protein
MAKVMLVEDDNNLREIYEARLQAEGYTIVAAKDGEEALVVAKAEKPDLIISDVMMPRISGFEMLDILRNTDGLKEVKVIMLTALGQSDDQQRADRLGADRYLVKSQVTLEDIVKVAHELLQDAPATDPTPAVATAAAPAEPTSLAPAPVPAPEPVAVAPAPEPSVVDAPAPAPEPVTPLSNDDAQAATDGAQTTSQEEASVEAKIEDFVAGASSDATSAVQDQTPAVAVAAPADTPSPAPAPAPVAVAPEPATAPEPSVVEAPVAPASEPAPAPSPEPTPEPAPAVPPVAAEPPKKEKKPENDNVTIAHKKVIEPLGNPEGKPDLDTLVALEEAKEAAQQAPPAPAPPTAVVATNETGQQVAPIDPNAAQAQATDFAAGGQNQAAPGAAPANGDDPNAIAL